MWLAWRSLAQLVLVLGVFGAHDATYHNQFAVHVPNGERHVRDIAKRHGYVNHGQTFRNDGWKETASSGSARFLIKPFVRLPSTVLTIVYLEVLFINNNLIINTVRDIR
ncbi:hypothetical protein RR48_08102 [Papilio machaon]|uniref:Peptidase S8 pro-domain domain-containing protein n=1 Tax=Papilio machaon TaxID=76193 RepID=A0A194RKK9_PAPMA|nr:hypothetical protein RR48_08102 [Papilio machaon]